MTADQIEDNPLSDFTTPDLITLVVSDIGILTPSVGCRQFNGRNKLKVEQGISDTLLRIFSE